MLVIGDGVEKIDPVSIGFALHGMMHGQRYARVDRGAWSDGRYEQPGW